jgi:hypothetical protein
MGKHSSLGPIDPQVAGIPAHGIIEEFARARDEIVANNAAIPLWQPIIAKYSPTLIGECQKAIDWSRTMVNQWMANGMFVGEADALARAKKVVDELGDHALTLSHSRHVSIDQAKALGIQVTDLESDPKLQDAVLSVHHACIQTLDATNAYKIIENHRGVAFIQQVRQALIGVSMGG